MQAMAECSGPPQSTRKDVLGTFYPSPEPVDSSTPSSAPLSRRTLLRHSSFVRAVCVDAPVRICAGGDQRWSSLPRQLYRARSPLRGNGRGTVGLISRTRQNRHSCVQLRFDVSARAESELRYFGTSSVQFRRPVTNTFARKRRQRKGL